LAQECLQLRQFTLARDKYLITHSLFETSSGSLSRRLPVARDEYEEDTRIPLP
jgi:hypothetical protein